MRFWEILRGYFPLALEITDKWTWFRARKCADAEGYGNLHQMLYPPADLCTGYGRANLPGLPSLYASSTLVTALDETRPNAGDFVQAIVIGARPGVQYPCHVVGETERVTKSGHSSMGLKTTEEHFITEYQRGITNKHLTDLFIDSFFAAWFRERVDEPLDYKKTAIYSSLIHGLGSGLIYPSVMSAGAVNIAIPATDFDKYFEVFFTTLYRGMSDRRSPTNRSK